MGVNDAYVVFGGAGCCDLRGTHQLGEPRRAVRVKQASWCAFTCIRRTKLLGANNSETEEIGKMGFSGYFGLLVIIAWLLGDFDS